MVHLRPERLKFSKKDDLETEEDQYFSNIRRIFLNFIWSAWDSLPYSLDLVIIKNIKKQCIGSCYWDVCFLFAKQLHLFLFDGVEVIEYDNSFGDRIKLLTIASKLFNIISTSCVQ